MAVQVTLERTIPWFSADLLLLVLYRIIKRREGNQNVQEEHIVQRKRAISSMDANIVIIIFFYRSRVSLCSYGACPGTRYVTSDSQSSACPCLPSAGVKVCTTTIQLIFNSFISLSTMTSSLLFVHALYIICMGEDVMGISCQKWI